ncbi:MAG: GNAT family protein [Anaerolineales bacterium]|nr:GNAT family protein [Anaerolineales bacterium]
MGNSNETPRDEQIVKPGPYAELPFSLPTLRSKRLCLRPVEPDDYRTLFLWHSDPRSLYLWLADRYISSLEEFVEDFRRLLRTHIQIIFIIELVEEGKGQIPVGMVYTYNTSSVDRYTYLCLYLSPEHTAKGIGPEAGYLAAEYLFTYFGFRKIYSEIFAYNHVSLRAAQKNGFREEGCLKAHRWFGDRYWDLYILSITFEDLKELTAPIDD